MNRIQRIHVARAALSMLSNAMEGLREDLGDHGKVTEAFQTFHDEIKRAQDLEEQEKPQGGQ